MIKWILPFTAAALLLIAGCSAPKETAAVRPKTLSLEEVMTGVRARAEYVKTLRGDGTITTESRESSQNGSFDVDLKKPDSVLVQLHGPFGLHVGTLSLSRDTFVFYNRMASNAVVGKPDGKTLRSLFHLNMQFDELLNAFTGEFPLPEPDDTLERFYLRDDEYIAVYRSTASDGPIHREYRIDSEVFIIDSYRILDGTGKPTMIASASRPIRVGEFQMPRLLRVVFPVDRRSVTVSYDNIKLNEPVECAFTLPPRVPKTYK